MAQDDPQLNFRCPAGLKATLELAAKANNRSLNAEIVHRLNQSVQIDEKVTLIDPQETIIGISGAELKRLVVEALSEWQRSERLRGKASSSRR